MTYFAKSAPPDESASVTGRNDLEGVRHTRLGVWDLYEDLDTERRVFLGLSAQIEDAKQCLPYVWRMLVEISHLRDCRMLLVAAAVVHAALAFVPAVSLWFASRLMQLTEAAITTRNVNVETLVQMTIGYAICIVVRDCLAILHERINEPLHQRIRQHFGGHVVRAHARLDFPTFNDSIVRGRLNTVNFHFLNDGHGNPSVAWFLLDYILILCRALVSLIAQTGVLMNVLQNHSDGFLLTALAFVPPLVKWLHPDTVRLSMVWAGFCRDDKYQRMKGIEKVLLEPQYRKEVVAGNLSTALLQNYDSARLQIGDNSGDFAYFRKSRHGKRFQHTRLLAEALTVAPQFLYALRAVTQPASAPISLGAFTLIQTAVDDFKNSIRNIQRFVGFFTAVSDQVQTLYGIVDFPNAITDGPLAFPENQQELRNGISVEFRNVSFKYPDREEYALRNVSFRIEQGHLCVIVGTNGSGKSTILKLIMRLYDPSNGVILINGHDIKSLKLEHLRRAVTVLFQDFTHFPLSLRDNVALGCPEAFSSPDIDDYIAQATNLVGANEFIEKLPKGLDTYIERPIQDYFSSLPTRGTKKLCGKDVDHTRVKAAGALRQSCEGGMSGGQLQRLAVARTLMKTLVAEDGMGMLLFDEPSASLDPAAEYVLFERLLKLRGNKTMIFSTHRFGNLNRYADVILYMKDAHVEDIGTHSQLVKNNGGYARVYDLQAQAFNSE